MRYSNLLVSILCVLFLFVSVNNALSATKNDPSAVKNATTSDAQMSDKININDADQSKLTQLPGVGPKMATRIIDYRTENGPFKSVDGLLNVKGIGPKVLQKLKPFVKIS